MNKELFLDKFKGMLHAHGTNVMTDGLNVWLLGYRIYKRQGDVVYITDAGFPTVSTCRWLNALLAQVGIHNDISVKKRVMHFRGKPLQSHAWYRIVQSPFVACIEQCMPPVYESSNSEEDILI